MGLIVLVPIFYLTANIWLTLLFGASLVLGFSFFHDGYYYAERNELDGSYPHGFWSFSTTSTSWMDKHGLTTALARIIYFAISLTIIIIFFICYHFIEY